MRPRMLTGIRLSVSQAILLLVLIVAVIPRVEAASFGTWINTGNLNVARAVHTATLLLNGMVLVTGGFGNTSNLNTGRLQDHTATLLKAEGPRCWRSGLSKRTVRTPGIGGGLSSRNRNLGQYRKPEYRSIRPHGYAAI